MRRGCLLALPRRSRELSTPTAEFHRLGLLLSPTAASASTTRFLYWISICGTAPGSNLNGKESGQRSNLGQTGGDGCPALRVPCNGPSQRSTPQEPTVPEDWSESLVKGHPIYGVADQVISDCILLSPEHKREVSGPMNWVFGQACRRRRARAHLSRALRLCEERG